MRRFWKRLQFRLSFIVFVSILCLLIVLPRIPIKVSYKFVTIDTYVGGYAFSLGDKFVDFSGFNKGLDFSRGKRWLFRPVNEEVASETLLPQLSKRLEALNITSYKVDLYTENSETLISVDVPEAQANALIPLVLSGRGAISLKSLASETEWISDAAAEIATNPDAWTQDALVADAATYLGGSLTLHFSAESRQRFSELALANVDKPIGVFYNDEPIPIAMPVISEQYAQSAGQIDPVISGDFGGVFNSVLVPQLASGKLPTPLSVVSEQELAPGVPISYSYKHIAVGIGIFALFVVLTRRRMAIAQLGALSVYTLFTLCLVKVLHIALTLVSVLALLLSFISALYLLETFLTYVWLHFRSSGNKSIALLNGRTQFSKIKICSFIVTAIVAIILYVTGDSLARDFAQMLLAGSLGLVFAFMTVNTLLELVGIGRSYEKKAN